MFSTLACVEKIGEPGQWGRGYEKGILSLSMLEGAGSYIHEIQAFDAGTQAMGSYMYD